MTFYFARHGETDWNVEKRIQGKTDIPLNENGIRQAAQLADDLAGQHLAVAAVYTSPQLRAAKTAQVVAGRLGVPCYDMDDLREMDLGEWEGSNWDAIREDYGETYQYWLAHRRYTKMPGGECYDEVLKRTLDALGEIISRESGRTSGTGKTNEASMAVTARGVHGAQDVLVVTHSAILRTLRCYIARCPFEEMSEKFRAGNVEVVPIDAADVRGAIERYAAGE